MLSWLSRIEVLIAIVAFALLAVLTVPRGVDAAVSRPGDELRDAYEIVQNAIDRYALDHHVWPGAVPAEETATRDALWQQLTQCTNAAGQTSPTHDTEFCYGPYLDAQGAGAELLVEMVHQSSTEGPGFAYNPANGRLSARE